MIGAIQSVAVDLLYSPSTSTSKAEKRTSEKEYLAVWIVPESTLRREVTL